MPTQSPVKTIGLPAGLLVAGLLLLLPGPAGMSAAAWATVAVAAWMMLWWLTEAVPFAVTALLPLLALPLLGVADMQRTAAAYANPLIFLFMGGFVLSLTLQRWNLHRRIAVGILRISGSSPAGMVGGVMLASAFLSMWISNTATAMMMLPIVQALISLGSDELSEQGDERRNFTLCMLLGTAYGVTFGGLATLVGTVPNALLAAFAADHYGIQVGFLDWMLVGTPVALVLLLAGWLLLTRLLYPFRSAGGVERDLRLVLGTAQPLSLQEKMVLAIFVATSAAWVLQPLLERQWPGLELSDAGIAIAGALCLLACPSGKGGFLLDWENTRELPWGVLLLFGGGLALADAMNGSGLAAWLSEAMSGFSGWSLPVMLLALLVVTVFLSELLSNTALTAMLLPVIAALALARQDPPLLLLAPVALAASCAFMLPVGTPPNAIVFATGKISMAQMAKAGFFMNLIGIMVLLLAAFWLVGPVFLPTPGAPASGS